jgi:hypothetical protein
MPATKKHTAKRLSKGEYLYRGYRIEYFDYATLGDPECNEKQWNIYPPQEGSWSEYGDSLGQAKRIVDRILDRNI